ncbi:PAS domain S-box protein [bacterium]|nr:PAS domain S-box protein [bacterium]
MFFLPKESLKLYKDVFLESLDPAVIFNRKGSISYVNNALLKIGGYTIRKLKGKPLVVLVPEEERARVKNIIEEVLTNKRTFREFNTFLLTGKGKQIPVALTLIPLLDKKELIGGLAVFVDIRQLRGLLESLNKAKVELEERVRERTKELEKRTTELEKIKKELEEAKTILEIKVRARTRELRELNETLEEKVKERTRELQEKVDELNKWYQLTVGREIKMSELKEENERLKEEIKKLKNKSLSSKRK